AIYNTQFPTHTYNAAGNYNVTLTVTSQSGCVRTVTVPNAVRTGTPPTVNFSFVPNNFCASSPVQFTDLSVTTPGAFVQWYWDFGDDSKSVQQNPQHVYVDTGALIVSLVVSNNGCADTAFKSIQILPPVAKFGYRLDCSNRTQVTFLDSSLASPVYGPVTYEWRMGDPANTVFFGTVPPTFTYPAIGTYTATLIVTNGPCSYQTTKDIIIANEPADFNISKNPVCKSEVFTLSAINSTAANIKDYTWSIGAATISDTSRNIQYSLPAYGTYNVTLTIEDINGCMNTQTMTNFITVSGPVANFAPDGPGGCVNSNIGFTDLSTPAGAVTQWTWNYGDGNQQTYTSPPFNHTYAQTGSYSVSLMIRSTVACADTITLPNAVVITQPDAAFKADTIYCPASPLQFIDTSSGSGLTYTWYFGDGGTSTLQNPTHSYPAGNNDYTVKLVISDMVGCQDSVTKNQYIKIRTPRPAFSMIDSVGVCIPLVTSFNFMGADYQNFYWDFGDGGTSFAQNPSHFYNAYGTFTPKLYLTGAGGCIDSADATVQVYDPATDMQVLASPLTACNTITTDFTLTTLPGFRFKFYFGDGAIDSSQQTTLTHTYSSPGVYTPYIIVSDKFGCDAVHYGENIHVYGAIPLFGTNKKEFCDQGEVFFMNYTLNNDPIISTVWDFGDGNTSGAQEPSHVFTGAGTYIVRLTVTTQNQCTSSYTDTIRLYPTPQLSITGKDTICINSSAILNGVLAQPDSTITWRWSVGNGNQLQNATVVYPATGNYTVTLIATNKLSCSDTATHVINVVPLPTDVAVANPIEILSGGSASLNMNYMGPIANYNWLPPQDLDCSNCMTPVASPQFTTRYVVQVEDRFGCKNSGEITVQVACAAQNFFVPNTFSPNGDGSNDVFYLRGTGLFRVKVMRIFNRWGEIVFEKREFPVNNAAFGWDGSYKGKKGQAGVYVYQVEIICNNGELIKYAGNIALIQ
ncbi:MAG TPA: PKD domain-containing protein, partial [Chitinophagaceae bacterium]